MKSTELRIGNYRGYKVREDGIIFSTRHDRPLKYRNNDKGYPCVSLSTNGKTVFRRVHRVLAELFIPNPLGKPCVNHKDRDRTNYSLDNLEWVTHSENVIHSVNNGGRKGLTRNNSGENNPNSKLNWITINAIRDLHDVNYSQNQLAEIFGLCQSVITKIVNYKIWKLKN